MFPSPYIPYQTIYQFRLDIIVFLANQNSKISLVFFRQDFFVALLKNQTLLIDHYIFPETITSGYG